MAEYEYARPTSGTIALPPPRNTPSSSSDDVSSGKRSCDKAAGGVVDISAVSSAVVVRKPRGRPPGSKNKPKPPTVVTRESKNVMHPVVLEVAAGFDVVENVAAFARGRRLGLSVLSGSGVVTNVALLLPGPQNNVASLPGSYGILSLAGSVVPSRAADATEFTVMLAGQSGQVIGGTIMGALMAAEKVTVVASTFQTSEFLRLPDMLENVAEGEEGDDVKPVVVPMEASGYATPRPIKASFGGREVALWPVGFSTSRPSLRPPGF